MKEDISIEEILNSRCSCDFDGKPKKNHWGIFIKNTHLSPEIKEHMLQSIKIPQFSNGKLSAWFEDEYLFLAFEKTTDPFETRLLHIESGMQQEAVYLASTALGLGTCIHNLGVNGTEYGNRVMTARHLLLEKEDPYKSGEFSTAPPGPEKPFKKGKILNEPKRKGDVDCLSNLGKLTLSEDHGAKADEIDISQLLWAAKGRTPHYIKSHPWGLTIPTWAGGQRYTRLYFVRENKLFRYINWTKFRYLDFVTRSFPWWILGNPTHDIEPVNYIDILSELNITKNAILISRNEKTSRTLWEAGYMLENMLLQAKSLGLSYKIRVFKRDEITALDDTELSEPVASLLL